MKTFVKTLIVAATLAVAGPALAQSPKQNAAVAAQSAHDRALQRVYDRRDEQFFTSNQN